MRRILTIGPDKKAKVELIVKSADPKLTKAIVYGDDQVKVRIEEKEVFLGT